MGYVISVSNIGRFIQFIMQILYLITYSKYILIIIYLVISILNTYSVFM